VHAAARASGRSDTSFVHPGGFPLQLQREQVPKCGVTGQACCSGCWVTALVFFSTRLLHFHPQFAVTVRNAIESCRVKATAIVLLQPILQVVVRGSTLCEAHHQSAPFHNLRASATKPEFPHRLSIVGGRVSRPDARDVVQRALDQNSILPLPLRVSAKPDGSRHRRARTSATLIGGDGHSSAQAFATHLVL